MSRAAAWQPPEPATENRRKYRRVKVAGVALLTPAERSPAVWIIHNLSMGGASVTVGTGLVSGSVVPLTLLFPDRRPIKVSARVLRRQLSGAAGRCALAFVEVSPEESAAIAAVIHAEETAPAPSATVIVVARASRRRMTLMRTLAALGHEARVTSSPQEAAAWLLRETLATSILVEDKLIEVDGWSLLEFVRDVRPTVQRLAIPDTVHSFRLNLALRSGAAQAVIERPFRTATLAPKVGTRG